MLKSRSSLSRRTSSSRLLSSPCSAPCRSAVLSRARPFSLTRTSPSFRPPLWRSKGQGAPEGQAQWGGGGVPVRR